MGKGEEFPGKMHDVEATEGKLQRILRRAELAEAKRAQEELAAHEAEVERARQRRVRARREREEEGG